MLKCFAKNGNTKKNLDFVLIFLLFECLKCKIGHIEYLK